MTVTLGLIFDMTIGIGLCYWICLIVLSIETFYGLSWNLLWLLSEIMLLINEFLMFFVTETEWFLLFCFVIRIMICPSYSEFAVLCGYGVHHPELSVESTLSLNCLSSPVLNFDWTESLSFTWGQVTTQRERKFNDDRDSLLTDWCGILWLTMICDRVTWLDMTMSTEHSAGMINDWWW